MLKSLLNNAKGLHANIFIKKKLQRSHFAEYIAKRLRTSILKNSCERLFLHQVETLSSSFKKALKKNIERLIFSLSL